MRGCKPGPGNPNARGAAAKGKALRKALDQAMSPANVAMIVRRLKKIVRNGEDKDAARAAEILMNRYFGKPAQQIEVADDSPKRISLAFVPQELIDALPPQPSDDAES